MERGRTKAHLLDVGFLEPLHGILDLLILLGLHDLWIILHHCISGGIERRHDIILFGLRFLHNLWGRCRLQIEEEKQKGKEIRIREISSFQYVRMFRTREQTLKDCWYVD